MIAGVLALIAVAGVAATVLFRMLVAAAGRDRARRTEDAYARLEKEVGELRRSIEALHRTARDPQPDAVAPVEIRGGMNRTRRAEALRLAKRGESASHIAALLGVPRAEVDLLLKMQALERKPATS
ncbi:MAG: hypothetical protein K2X35_01910 [Bryobacteraceae bacterium]|nr:hypothetical protein [Bryobacteraceae bacterium]